MFSCVFVVDILKITGNVIYKLQKFEKNRLKIAFKFKCFLSMVYNIRRY